MLLVDLCTPNIAIEETKNGADRDTYAGWIAWRDSSTLLKDSSTPLWIYTTGGDVHSVSISADGEYIVAGSYDNKVYLFDKDSSTPLWSHDTQGVILSVDIKCR